MRLATGAILLVTAIWGSTFFIIKDAVSRVDPIDFLAVRFLVGALVPSLIFLGRLRRLSWRQWSIALGLGVLYGFAQIAQTTGLQTTAASASGFLTGVYVVLTPLILWALFRVRPQRVTWVAVALAMAGIAVLSLSGLTGIGRGEALTLLGAALYALHIVMLDRFSRAMDPVSLATVQLIGIAIICGGAALPTGIDFTPDGVVWAAVLYTAIAAGIATMVLQTWAQRHIPPSRVVLLMAFEPVFATLFAVLFGGETLTLRFLLGGSMILAATLIGVRAGPGDRAEPLVAAD
ncbi:DMT family transporter [Tessaracoccus lacteus]|uniref:DMT family transporter n=1 Tax=Tessaracoccus lacteus TaxID=3041766 RepID=A0ABY8PYC9_9ACTN|nr:DMT family transporter [Tessaracoccus sp. T21]WGT47514.1 DMT family transporter [Tessaracoccus sp. T21]